MSQAPDISTQVELFRNDYDKLKEQLSAVIVGQQEVIDATLTAFDCWWSCLD